MSWLTDVVPKYQLRGSDTHMHHEGWTCSLWGVLPSSHNGNSIVTLIPRVAFPSPDAHFFDRLMEGQMTHLASLAANPCRCRAHRDGEYSRPSAA